MKVPERDESDKVVVPTTTNVVLNRGMHRTYTEVETHKQSIPGVSMDEWLKNRGAGPVGSIQVSSGALTKMALAPLQSKAAECEYAIDKLDEIIACQETITASADKSGVSKDTIIGLLKQKRVDLVSRREAMRGAIQASNGVMLVIEHNGQSYAFT